MINHELDLNISNIYLDAVKRFEIYDSLKSILESRREVSQKIIGNCLRMSIKNFLLIFEILKVDEYVFQTVMVHLVASTLKKINYF